MVLLSLKVPEVCSRPPTAPVSFFMIYLTDMNKEQATEILSKYDSSTPLFSLAGMETWCRLVELYDGDTCKVVFQFSNNDVHKIILRINGIDTPEMKSKDPTVQKWAVRARNRMLSLLAPDIFNVDGDYSKKDIIRLLKENVCMLWVKTLAFDRYGRLLADLYYSPADTKTIQSILIDENYCKSYSGKTKQQWVAEDCKLNASA